MNSALESAGVIFVEEKRGRTGGEIEEGDMKPAASDLS